MYYDDDVDPHGDWDIKVNWAAVHIHAVVQASKVCAELAQVNADVSRRGRGHDLHRWLQILLEIIHRWLN